MELWEKIKSNAIVQKVVDFVCKYTNVKPILEFLQSAKSLQKTISIILRVFTVLFAIMLFIVWIISWRFINYFQFFGGLGYFIWQLAYLYAGIVITKILYQRFTEIVDLPKSEYIITPIIAQVIVTVGEVFFIFLAVMSVPAMLAIWLGGTSLSYGMGSIGSFLSLVDILNPGGIFMAGISVFIMSWVIGFLILVFARLTTETVLALVSIAKDASIIRTKTTTIARRK
jgi:hypothetical protein